MSGMIHLAQKATATKRECLVWVFKNESMEITNKKSMIITTVYVSIKQSWRILDCVKVTDEYPMNQQFVFC